MLFAGLLVAAALLAQPESDASVGTALPALLITTTSLATGEVGVAYVQRLAASGGDGRYRYSTSSVLPPGLRLSAGGEFSGTPQAAANESIVVSVTDAANAKATAELTLVITSALSITSTTPPVPVVGAPYSTVLQASGGIAPYAWSVTGGPLPLGLVLESDGTLSGLPAEAGTTTTIFTVTDAAGGRTNAAISVTVAASPEPAASYFVVSRHGAVRAYATPGTNVAQTADDGPTAVVGIATDATGGQYWLASADGHITSSPGFRSYGSVARRRLAGRVVGIAALPAGTGYWVVSSTGHIYGFGAAHSFGSVSSRRLVGQVVGIAADPAGTGYWVVSSTGHVYGFGAAHVLRGHGRRLRGGGDVVGIAADPVADGYWVVNRAGRVFGYGAATLQASLPAAAHLHSVIGIAADPAGGGYWLALAPGVVDAFGDASPLAAVEAEGSGAIAIASAG